MSGRSICVAALLAALAPAACAQAVAIDADDIGGVVRGPRGPEVGVWVIAEKSSSTLTLVGDGKGTGLPHDRLKKEPGPFFCP